MKSCWRKTVFLLPAAVSFAFASQRKENPQRRDVFAGVPFLLWGGTSEAERRILVFLPSYQDPEGFWEHEKTDASLIVPIAVRPRGPRFAEELTHRDFLYEGPAATSKKGRLIVQLQMYLPTLIPTSATFRSKPVRRFKPSSPLTTKGRRSVYFSLICWRETRSAKKPLAFISSS